MGFSSAKVGVDTFFKNDDSVLKTYEIDYDAVAKYEKDSGLSKASAILFHPVGTICGVVCSPCICTYLATCHSRNSESLRRPCRSYGPTPPSSPLPLAPRSCPDPSPPLPSCAQSLNRSKADTWR